mmetsp:Transcript_69995/g.198381  ORF Transcript_69995/g.198381 Transcript_69995/m.198381 type:complete len:761 (+) Transcript_69995:70-2352(+)
MKPRAGPARLLLLLGAVLAAAGRRLRGAEAGDRTITKVVKLLQQMLDDSRTEADAERSLYAKHKCYCDDNQAAKTQSVAALTKEIGVLENQIEELRGSSARLSSECAQLQADMSANEQMRLTAAALRTQENQAFVGEEADLVAAIGQLGQAVDVLATIGADQRMASAQHTQYMANYTGSLLHMRASVKQALLAANAFLTPAQQSKADVLLQQAPFAGSYSVQSGAIFGILTQMKETFESNLESARSAEAAANRSHTEFMSTKTGEWDTMKASYDTKQGTLSTNDNTLGDKKQALATAVQQKADDEDFLQKLGVMCSGKEEEYEARKTFRAQEEAAISQAIAILDSDQAFGTFGNVAATSTGSTGFLLQLSTPRRLKPALAQRPAAGAGQRVARLLQEAARSQRSSKLARIAAMLAAGNPFTRVLEAIQQMKEVIREEGVVDQKQFDWCAAERQVNGMNLLTKMTQIGGLNTDISTLVQTIDDPVTGLKVTIQQIEESLVQNSQAQTDETKARRDENALYQRDVANAAEAEALLKKAIDVLDRHYTAIEEAQLQALNASFVQADPAPPATWSGSYAGQRAQGTSVIRMLSFVLSETQKEEQASHNSEQQAQVSYEDSMAQLKTQEGNLQTSLLQDQKALADAELDLAGKRADLERTEREKTAIERYLEKIKPGCDFITTNFADRKQYRQQETAALDKAVQLLSATPAFAAAKTAEKHSAWGACAGTCVVDEAHVDCKACLAGVSVPGYCAGHPGTQGCSAS